MHEGTVDEYKIRVNEREALRKNRNAEFHNAFLCILLLFLAILLPYDFLPNNE